MMHARKEEHLSLKAKVEISKSVIRDAFEKYLRPTVVWSAGKDSTVVLNLVKEVVMELGMRMPPALFIDHGDHFPETLELLQRVSSEWEFQVLVARNEDLLANVSNGIVEVSSLSEKNVIEARKAGLKDDHFDYSLETEVGNHLLKTVAMNSAISRYRFDSLFVGIRWDENIARSSEVFISSREKPAHVRVQPILPFLERDVWEYTLEKKLPVHPKYKEGYRSIDGINDSKKISDLPAWEQSLETTNERAGRSQDKEGMMEKLRVMGYM